MPQQTKVKWSLFGEELTFTDLLWSPRLIRPQQILLETRRSLGIEKENMNIFGSTFGNPFN